MNFGPFTIALVVITALISFPAMNDDRLINRLILWPWRMKKPSEYYRLLTSGFIHADFGHLLFNMFALLGFGSFVEGNFGSFTSPWVYIFLYLSAIVMASLPSFFRHRNDAYYRALGASGGTAAVLFSSVYFGPWQGIYLYFIPIPIPSILFAGGYLAYSAWASKRGTDNIGHDAHFWGSVYGFVFTVLCDPSHGLSFIQQLMHPPYNFG